MEYSDPDVLKELSFCLHLEDRLGGWWEYKENAVSDWPSCKIGT